MDIFSTYSQFLFFNLLTILTFSKFIYSFVSPIVHSKTLWNRIFQIFTIPKKFFEKTIKDDEIDEQLNEIFGEKVALFKLKTEQWKVFFFRNCSKRPQLFVSQCTVVKRERERKRAKKRKIQRKKSDKSANEISFKEEDVCEGEGTTIHWLRIGY